MLTKVQSSFIIFIISE